MKAINLIHDALSEWRPVRSAPDLAHELYKHLDADEVERLAIAGLTGEVRKALTKRVKGIPVYSNVETIDPATGKKVKQYKQTNLFNVDDFRIAADSYMKRTRSNYDIACALAAACVKKYGVQLAVDIKTWAA